MDKLIMTGFDKIKLKQGLTMSTNDKLVHQIKEQISLCGTQVKQRMKDIQLELLEELGTDHGPDSGLNLH